jgi:hypothetical protein
VRRYAYVGPPEVQAASLEKEPGDLVLRANDVRAWALRTDQVCNGEGLIRATYTIDAEWALRVADYGSEHVACAAGGPVYAAGVAWFEVAPLSVTVVRIDNHSTGFCPEPSSWAAVERVLDAAGIGRPGRFTKELVFRRCACGQRNVVHDDHWACAVCGAELPREWNFHEQQRSDAAG